MFGIKKNSIKFGIMGVGKMGSATLEGVLSSKAFCAKDIIIFDSNKAATERYKKRGVNVADSEKDLLEKSNLLLLAVKPQSFADVEKLKDIDCSNKGIISFAPGKKISYLETIFNGALITRAMPNTPALIGSATATLYTNGKGNIKLLDYVKKIFSSIGTYEFLEKEEDIDIAIPLNGSMPAYLFSFVKEFVNRAVEKGIEKKQAFNLCVNSIIGSCKLLLSSDKDIDEQIDAVCSKGGTTIAGLEKLYENNFKEAIYSCYDACSSRSIELGS